VDPFKGGSSVPIETCTSGRKRVDVAELYDPETYRARVRHPLGMPMFLY
jgi:6-phosphofructokinase 1